MSSLRLLSPGGGEWGLTDLVARLGTEPGVRANMVSSVDGHATIEGRVGALTGAADQALLLALRGWCDVLLVGSGTVRAEGYGVVDLPDEVSRLRAARGQSPHPVLAVLSGTADLDPDLPAFAQAGPDERPWLVTTADADAANVRRLEPYARPLVVESGSDGRPSLPAALAALRAAGQSRVLSEGGPTVLGDLVRDDLVDELFLTVSPRLVGGAGTGILHTAAYPDPVDLQLVEVLGADGEVFLRYRVTAASGSGGAERA